MRDVCPLLMSYFRYGGLLALLVLLTGCMAHHAPPGNLPFADILTTDNLDGIYRNLGETGDNQRYPRTYLSQVLWPAMRKPELRHDAYEKLEISASEGGDLQLRAISGSKGTVSWSLQNGKDFDLRSGKLFLSKNETGFKLSEGKFVHYTGIVNQTNEFGVDLDGNGKYVSKTSFLGAALVVVPVAGGITVEVSFKRIR